MNLRVLSRSPLQLGTQDFEVITICWSKHRKHGLALPDFDLIIRMKVNSVLPIDGEIQFLDGLFECDCHDAVTGHDEWPVGKHVRTDRREHDCRKVWVDDWPSRRE